MDGAYTFFCPGSLGIVDPRDVSKVVFEGAVARLASDVVAPGGGSRTEVEAQRAVAVAPVGEQAFATMRYGEQVFATIRYPVPDRFGQGELGGWAIVIRYRDGDGRVIANLMETSIPQGLSNSRPSSSRTLLTFDSAELGADGLGPIFGPPEPYFRTHKRGLDETGPPSPLSNYTPDPGANVYYLEVTLTGRLFGGPYPPAVAAIGIAGITT
jgi:hypothetical protein